MGSPTPVDPARTAMLARRAAAARRRGVLVAVLLSVTVFTAVLGSVSPVPWWVALIPASLCVTVMVLGRRAVVAQQRADRAWERRNRERSRPTGQTRRREQTPTEAKLAARSAQHNSARRHSHEDVSTSVLSPTEVAYVASTHRTGTPVSADVRPSRSATSPAHAGSAPMHEDQGAAVAHRSSEQLSQHQHHATNATDQPADSDGPKRDNAQQGTPWQAVPVPPPVYTMKAAAPTWEPPPSPRNSKHSQQLVSPRSLRTPPTRSTQTKLPCVKHTWSLFTTMNAQIHWEWISIRSSRADALCNVA